MAAVSTPTTSRRARGLSRQAFLEAALAIADEEGLEQLTMRSLARRVGSDPTAVYRYFSSKDEILAAIVDLALSELEPPAAPATPAEARALAFRAALLRHPGVVPLMVVETTMTPMQVRAAAAAMADLQAAGLTPGEALDVYCAVYAYVVGFVAQEVAAARVASSVDLQRDQVRALARQELGELPGEQLDAIAVAAAFRQSGDAQFLFGLRRLLGSAAG